MHDLNKCPLSAPEASKPECLSLVMGQNTSIQSNGQKGWASLTSEGLFKFLEAVPTKCFDFDRRHFSSHEK